MTISKLLDKAVMPQQSAAADGQRALRAARVWVCSLCFFEVIVFGADDWTVFNADWHKSI
ncbi:hypothetical protein [Nitrosomonas marina]|uniref:hypothetical protein n=1 Tax=Nitrosomonas marina TaxID=917 RepID=UPI000B82E6BE|nr:hypothetical protein [Nitrosomonas marina]